MALRMRQSLAEFEREFLYEAELVEQRREAGLRHVARRSRHRSIQRERKRSSKRFYLLTLSLILTAAVVAVAMFATLYLLLA